MTRYFGYLARLQPNHAGLWHLLGEVEAVFGVWAVALLAFMAAYASPKAALSYLESRTFTEPAFIFAIMVIAASRPILDFAGVMLHWMARLLPLQRPIAYYFTLLFIGPLLGSFITEPAAMTLSALLLRERYFSRQAPRAFKYGTLGVLFVNVSIGGTLTPFAAPPVLMVAERWGWDFSFMLQTFGWKAALAVLVNAAAATFAFRSYLAQLPTISAALARLDVPWLIVGAHLLFLVAIVVAKHHLVVFVALFLLFLGFAEAYRRYQSRLILREGLMVGLFLGGLVVLGGLQGWWLSPVLSNMSSTALFYGATALTAVTDNAALTYLGVAGRRASSRRQILAGGRCGERRWAYRHCKRSQPCRLCDPQRHIRRWLDQSRLARACRGASHCHRRCGLPVVVRPNGALVPRIMAVARLS